MTQGTKPVKHTKMEQTTTQVCTSHSSRSSP
jgi:hypothetical protein